uniref:response regulator transcription factor n=1 Tax=Aestuariimicrobium ganziense TaxID=2773677 RepID=UPI001940FE3E|nr:response regulator transcription factor [Aestuariimicrobium ganziense]
MIRLLLADDQAMVRGALGALLELESDMEVVAEVGTGTEVLSAAREHQPDVCLVDIQMPGMDGIQVAAQMKRALPKVAVLIVTTFNRPGYLRQALDAGAMGFVVKDSPASELARAVREVHEGRRVIDPTLAQEYMLSGPNPLTAREQQVLKMAAAGEQVSKIAQQVFLSPGTVRNLLSSAIQKTHTSNRIEAANRASEMGWI